MSKDLEDIINLYVKQMEKVNKKRMEFAERELKFVMEECQLFNTLRQNLLKFKEFNNGISKDKQSMEASGLVLRPEN